LPILRRTEAGLLERFNFDEKLCNANALQYIRAADWHIFLSLINNFSNFYF